MTISPRKALASVGAALALSVGWSATTQAAALPPCTGDELAGDWLVLYQLREAEYCKVSMDATGLITGSTCYSRRGKPLKAEMSGKLYLDPASCAVSHDTDPLNLSMPKGNGKGKGKGKGKYGAFKVEAQLSTDRSTLVGLFRFRTHLSHVTAQRTQ